MKKAAIVNIAIITLLTFGSAGSGFSDEGREKSDGESEPVENRGVRGDLGLLMPRMDSVAGRYLFASKGCVVCHAVNGIGGEDAPPLDAALREGPMNPFDFAAGMWRGAEAMIVLQQDEIGEQISLTGAELAALTAFAHDAEEQKKFSKADIPPEIDELLHHGDE